MDDEGFFVGMIIGMVVMAVVLIGVGWSIDVDSPEAHYRQNVCTYLDGTMHDDICIVDGRVVEINEAR